MSEIYYAHQKTCLFVAKSILQDDVWLAEDAVHNTFLAIIKKKELLELPDYRLRALILAIVKRRAIDLLRHKIRHKSENIDDMISIPSSEDSVEVTISTSEDFERLTEHLQRLNESYRSVLQLKYFSDLPNAKIGEYLGITSRQVEILLYNAKLRLRKSLNDANSDDRRGAL